MRYIVSCTFLILFISCQNETDKLIADFQKKTEAFEKKADEGNTTANGKELDKMGDEIGNIIIELSKKELTDDQQKKVSEISLRFQISLITVQDELNSKMKQDMMKMSEGLDSLGAEMQKMDSL